MKKDKVIIKPEMVSFRCSTELFERINRMSEKGEISRARLIENLCEMSIGSLEACEKVGLLQLSLLFRDMQKCLKEWSSDMKGEKQIPINNE